MSAPFTHTTAAGRAFTGRTNIGPDLEVRSGAPLVIALHGGTYSSAYFDIEGHSLLDNASALGVPVTALDRPNYVGSSPLTSEGSIIFANAEVIGEAIGSIWAEQGLDAPGIVLVAHSIGGAIATKIAATPQRWPLLGLATSGSLVRVPPESAGAWAALPDIAMIDLPVPLKDQLMFGPDSIYDAAMPRCRRQATRRTPSSRRPSCSTSPAARSRSAPTCAARSPFRCITVRASSTTCG